MQDQKLTLYAPAEARMADSVLLLWNKTAKAAQVKCYRIERNGQFLDTCCVTDYTAVGLAADSAHRFRVTEILADGSEGQQSEVVSVCTGKAGAVIDVTDMGAVGDGRTLNTQAIQAAIDACPAGGTVKVPEGYYRTGALFLKSDMTLQLDEGAVVLGSEDTADYPVYRGQFEGKQQMMYASLLNLVPHCAGYVMGDERLHDVKITGRGVIKANGQALFTRELAEKAGIRGRNIYMANVDRVYIQGVTIRESPAWCLHLLYCTQVTINDIRLQTKFDEEGRPFDIYNGDGIDPESCLDVNIVHSGISSQDDCIALKSGRDAEGRAMGKPTERVRISNCHFHNGFGVALGSEISGGIRDVLVQDCTFENSFSVGSIKAPRGRGNVVENALFENLTLINRSEEYHDCRWFRGGINVDMFYSVEEADFDTAMPFDEGTPAFRNIVFQNIDLETVGGNAIFISGLPESPVKKLTLRNVRAKGRYGLQVHHVEELTLENVVVEII